ncbi:MAG: hypothetical protein ACODAE_05210, partial [Gemmatimonadota bacterium]
FTLPDGSTVRGREAVIQALAAERANGGPPEDRPTKARGVAIVGFTDSRLKAPFGDADVECWGLNALHRMDGIDVGAFTRWFELHPRAVLEERHEGHLEWLKTCPLPVYMQRAWDDIPTSVAYPKAEVEARLGGYMTSSIAWMLALAILEGFQEIGVWGVDMASETEYAQQRPAVEYLLGIAQGLGRTVHVPESADLLKAVGQYGWQDSGPLRAKIRERRQWANKRQQQLRQKLAAHKRKIAEIEASIHQAQGVLNDLDYWERTWTFPSGENGRPEAEGE